MPVDFTDLKQHQDAPGSPEDVLKWLSVHRDYLDDETCSNMCDKTHEQQGCPSGTCSLETARKEIRATIAAFERDIYGASSEEYWVAQEEAESVS
jgi:hypothetical protein